MLDYVGRHLEAAGKIALKRVFGRNANIPADWHHQGFDYDLRIYPSDCDYNLHANHSRLIMLSEIARFYTLSSTGAFQKMLNANLQPLVLAEKITFRKELKAFEKFTIRTSLAGHDDKSMYIKHVFLSEKGCHAMIYVRVAFRVDGKFLDPLEAYNTLGIEYQETEEAATIRDWKSLEESTFQEIKIISGAA